jgi:hypothetical protein
MSNDVQTDHSELINAYHLSVKNRAVARRCTTLLTLGVVFVFVGLLWAEFNDFRYRKMPDFCTALSNEAADMTQGLSKDLMAVVNRVYPYYLTVFDQMFQRDLPTFDTELKNQLSQLDTFAQGEWPLIEKEITELILTTEEVSTEALAKFLSPDDARALSDKYAAVVGEQLTTYFDTRLHQHVAVAKNIGAQLDQISTMEPDMQRPVELTEALGLLLELSGIELQRGF